MGFLSHVYGVSEKHKDALQKLQGTFKFLDNTE